MKHLHPAAKWLFRFRAYFGILFLAIIGGAWIGGVTGALMGNLLAIFVIFFLVIIIIVLVVGEIYARMAYVRWMYEFAPSELKLEKGIIWKSYKSIPYNRVQNVEIHRGILARMFGFSTLDIQTAGYSGGYHRRGGMPRAEGHIPAVDPEAAEKIRKFLMKKIGKRSGSGL
jgi:membrane protein YdbS with pleckstrin-like domain